MIAWQPLGRALLGRETPELLFSAIVIEVLADYAEERRLTPREVRVKDQSGSCEYGNAPQLSRSPLSSSSSQGACAQYQHHRIQDRPHN